MLLSIVYFPLIKIILILAITTFNGIVIFNFLHNTKNKLVNIGAGMIVGLLVFLLLLSILSYLFKGTLSISIIFILYSIICFYLYKHKKKFSFTSILFGFNRSKTNLITTTFILIYLVIIALYTPTSGLGPDTYIYQGIASSFVRGNYPTVLPWQPDFLTVYHHGAFIIFGALQAISGMNAGLLQFIFPLFLIFAIFLFITGIARDRVRNPLCLIPAIFGLILFGGPIILTRGFDQILENFLTPNLISNLSNYPQFSDFRSANGSGASSLAGLVFYYFSAFGLASFLLYIYLLTIKFKNHLLKYAVLIFIMMLTLSVDETFFLIETLFLPIFFLYEYRGLKLTTFIYQGSILLILAVASFFLIQNPVRDSLLTKSPEAPRFQLFTPPIRSQDEIFSEVFESQKKNQLVIYQQPSFFEAILTRIEHLGEATIEKGKTSWMLVGLHFSIFISLVISVILKSSIPLLFSIGAIVGIFWGSVITNTFWPANYERLFQKSFQLILFSIGFLVIELFYKLDRKVHRIILLAILLFIFFPQIITSHTRFLDHILNKSPKTYLSLIDIHPLDNVMKSIGQRINTKDRIIFIDGYPFNGRESYTNLRATTIFGLFVPIAPPSHKTLTPDDQGVEFYDVMTSLDPDSIKILKLDYSFVFNEALKNLNENTLSNLQNSQYFEAIFHSQFGTLLKIKPAYKRISGNFLTLKKLLSLIPNGKTVYVDELYNTYLPAAIIFNLSSRTRVIGPPFAPGGGVYMYVEKLQPFYPVCTDCEKYKFYPSIKRVGKVDYFITDPKVNPENIFPGKYKRIGEVPHVAVWESISL